MLRVSACRFAGRIELSEIAVKKPIQAILKLRALLLESLLVGERKPKGLIMYKKLLFLLSIGFVVHVQAQDVLFDFENAPVHTSLPLAVTAGGITAQLSDTGQGFSIQPANSMGFTPVGFSGNCIYPNSIYASDLQVSFSTLITDFSILYAPQELACDSSATMRVSAYGNGALVGTATTNAQPGTWPSETLAFSSSQGFNSVVVHYDKAPVTGGDYGVIFLADNMRVTAAPSPMVLLQAAIRSDGAFQFSFANAPGSTCTVLTATNAALPLIRWTALSAATEISPGQFQFTDPQATNNPSRFYRVRSP